MWQFGQATTLTQRCWENVNTDQSIKVAKWVCTGFLRVHLMSWCEFALGAEQTGHPAARRTPVAWSGGPSLVWSREKILAKPKIGQDSLYSSITGSSEHHYAKSIHTAIRHWSTDLISSPLCSQVYNNVKRFMKPFFGQRSQNSVSAYLILRNVLNLSVQLSWIPFPLWHLYRKVKLAGKRRRTFSPAAPWDSNNIFSQNVSLYIPTPPPPLLTLPLSFL